LPRGTTSSSTRTPSKATWRTTPSEFVALASRSAPEKKGLRASGCNSERQRGEFFKL
jgi:hypothetical protein